MLRVGNNVEVVAVVVAGGGDGRRVQNGAL